MYKSKCIVKKIRNKSIDLFVRSIHSFIQGGFVFFLRRFWYRSILMILQFTLRTESRHLTKHINLKELSIIDGLMNVPLKKR